MTTKKVTAFVETLKGSRFKYKYDPGMQLLKVDKLLPYGLTFPCDFGFVPDTLAEDGDPLDILILNEEPLTAGCIIDCRIIGAMEARQTEKNKVIRNDRIIAVPSVSHLYMKIKNINELPGRLIDEIEYFFMTYHHYNNVKFKVLRIRGAAVAHSLIKKAKNGND